MKVKPWRSRLKVKPNLVLEKKRANEQTGHQMVSDNRRLRRPAIQESQGGGKQLGYQASLVGIFSACKKITSLCYF